MRSTLDELITELGQLKALVASIKPVNTALAGHNDPLVQQYVSIRRRFDYAAFAIALYASLEKFVENLVEAYARLETRRVEYAKLPEGLTKKHLAGSAELLSRRHQLGEGRYVGLNELGVVKNLFECLSGIRHYALNEKAVSAHDRNLRAEEIDRVFAAVGIDNICDRLCHADEIKSWFGTAQGLDTQPQHSVNRTVIERRLKDIVDRRNEVAHHGGVPKNFLGAEEMIEAVAFIQSLATSIFGLVVGRYFEAHHAASPGRVQLMLLAGTRPLKDGKVVCIHKPAQRLFVGQPVFVIVESTGARWGRIQSLRVEDADVPELATNANAPKGVGVGLDFKFPNNAKAKLVALPTDDDVVWSPLSAAAPGA